MLFCLFFVVLILYMFDKTSLILLLVYNLIFFEYYLFVTYIDFYFVSFKNKKKILKTRDTIFFKFLKFVEMGKKLSLIHL